MQEGSMANRFCPSRRQTGADQDGRSLVLEDSDEALVAAILLRRAGNACFVANAFVSQELLEGSRHVFGSAIGNQASRRRDV